MPRSEGSLRTIDLRSGGAFAEGGCCRAPGCMNATSDRKPYCIAHLGRMRYVQQVRAELDAMEAAVRPRTVVFGAALKKAV